jgi:hypothetical protein
VFDLQELKKICKGTLEEEEGNGECGCVIEEEVLDWKKRGRTQTFIFDLCRMLDVCKIVVNYQSLTFTYRNIRPWDYVNVVMIKGENFTASPLADYLKGLKDISAIKNFFVPYDLVMFKIKLKQSYSAKAFQGSCSWRSGEALAYPRSHVTFGMLAEGSRYWHQRSMKPRAQKKPWLGLGTLHVIARPWIWSSLIACLEQLNKFGCFL